MTAWIALVLSLMSFLLSCYLAWKDGSRISARATERVHELTGEYSSIFVSMSNRGRRPIILRNLVGKYSDGSIGGTQLTEAGIRLEEGDFYELEIGKFDGIMVNGDKMSELVGIHLEDSAGKIHRIKKSKAAIQLLRKSNHKFGLRTHG